MTYNHDPQQGGIKHDMGKALWHLLPEQLLEGVVQVLMDGAQKYDEWNWAQGMPFSRVFNSARRHLNRFFWHHEDYDAESGRHHLDHAIANLLFLRYYTLYQGHHDDRLNLPEPNTPAAVAQHGSSAIPPMATVLDRAQLTGLLEAVRNARETTLSRAGRPARAQAWNPTQGSVLYETRAPATSAGPDGDSNPSS